MPHNKNYDDLFEARKIYAKLKIPEDIFDIEFLSKLLILFFMITS